MIRILYTLSFLRRADEITCEGGDKDVVDSQDCWVSSQERSMYVYVLGILHVDEIGVYDDIYTSIYMN